MNKDSVSKEYFQNKKSRRQKIIQEYIFLIFRLINLELIKCVSENMFQKYFGKNNLKVILKSGKTVFSKNDGVQEEIC